MDRARPSCAAVVVLPLLMTGCLFERLRLGEDVGAGGAAIGGYTTAGAGTGGARRGTAGGTSNSSGHSGGSTLLAETGSNGGSSSARGGAPSVGGATRTGGTLSSVGGTSPAGGKSATGGGASNPGGASASGGRATTARTMTGGNSSTTRGSSAIGLGAASGHGGTVGTADSGGVTSGYGGTAGTTHSGGASTGGSIGVAGDVASLPPSCRRSDPQCNGESCCTTIAVPPGTYQRGRSAIEGTSDYFPNDNISEIPEHVANISSAFALDKYEVTIARFRAFLAEYDAWHKVARRPLDGDGAHPVAAGTGWQQSWTNGILPFDSATLRSSLNCELGTQTWRDTPTAASDNYPINCVNWYVAFAFCIWDDGRLPTEAEWEYVAAGGALNRLYPWGNAAPDATKANYAGAFVSASVNVGSKLAGAGAFGHLDLAGSLPEWVFDGFSVDGASFDNYSKYATTPCNDCVFSCGSCAYMGLRGGDWISLGQDLRAARRGGYEPITPRPYSGIRCARRVP